MRKAFYIGIPVLIAIGLLFGIMKENYEPVGRAEEDVSDELQVLLAKYGKCIQITEDGRVLVNDVLVTETKILSMLPPNTQVYSVNEKEGCRNVIVTKEPDPVRVSTST